MNDLNAEVPSTVIDVDAPAPGAAEYKADAPAPEAIDTPKPMSLEDAVKQAAAETKDKTEKPEQKEAPKAKETKPEVKTDAQDGKASPERGEGGKFKAKEEPVTSEKMNEAFKETSEGRPDEANAEAEQERGEPRPSEGRDITRAPAHFLPRAKEAWATTNDDVRSEVYRMKENYEKGLEEGREAMEFRKELREFEELAGASKTTLKDAMAGYVRIDKMLASDLPMAIKTILQTQGITPEQYAQYVMGQEQQRQQNPQAYAQTQETQQLKQQNEQLQLQVEQANQRAQEEESRRAAAEVERTLFAEVRQDHPRFDELRPIVLKVWNSDLLPSNMNERDKLYAAVDYAERINPVGSNAQHEPLNPATNAQRPLNPAGTKSVKGSLSYGAEVPRKSAKVSLDEAIKMAARSVSGGL